MFHLIDLERVRHTMGDLTVFDYVAAAFLGQLVSWRADFSRHSNVYEPMELKALVHKMKGSCQAVAALGVASELAQAEQQMAQVQPADWPPVRARLEALLLQLEAEIRGVMARPDER